jgi:hypothetical protein
VKSTLSGGIISNITAPSNSLETTSLNSSTSLLDSVFHLLQGKLENLHKEGQYLESACPQCGGNDRFFSGPKHNYQLWSCRNCGHSSKTATLAGLFMTVSPRPVVKPWQETDVDPPRLEQIRDLYRLLADYAHTQLWEHPHALSYLAGRGLNSDIIRLTKLGFLNATLYRQWHDGLTPLQRSSLHHAGLPELHGEHFRGFAAMFAGGYQGKIIFPYFNDDGTVVDLRTRSISSKDSVGGKPVRYTSPKLSLQERGATVPYGVEGVGKSSRVILTEGEFKRLVPLSKDFPWTVLALRGTNDPLEKYLPYLQGRLVVLAFDNDTKRDKRGLTPGESATVRIGRLLRAHGIAVGVLNPELLGDIKGIDDFVNMHDIKTLADLVAPGHTLTLSEFEAALRQNGAVLSEFTTPRADPGVVRRWTPGDHVDVHPHAEQETVSLEESTRLIHERTSQHWSGYQRGNNQLLITASAGVGKTTITQETAKEYAVKHNKTTAFFLPSHETIDEKIADGTLEGFQHIYGRRWDEDDVPNPIRNCEQANLAHTLQRYGYRPGAILCPTCPAANWCIEYGYRSQFKGKANRAYTHGHLHTDYPEGEDLVIVDELTHKSFIDGMTIWIGDIANVLQSPSITGEQRHLLEALLKLYTLPELADLEGAEFYEVLERVYPDLRNVDVWGDGSSVQMALDDIASNFSQSQSPWQADQLPQQFGGKLFALLSEDIRRLNAGRRPTGRIRFICPEKSDRRLMLTYAKGSLPGWYSKRPTVILNATADAGILGQLIGPVDVLAPSVATQTGNEIVHDITSNNSKTGLLGNSPDAKHRREIWLAGIRSHITDEKNTTIITTKALADYVRKAFPLARVAWFGALEGRNDLQADTIILANSPPVNLHAVRQEAAALFPDADTTFIRRVQAFEEQNAGGEYLTVEQIDAVDPRVQSLLWQHRDAMMIQAVHRARLVRETGRKVVIMSSRPVPGLPPTQIITERTAAPKAAQRTQETLDRIIGAAKELVDIQSGFTIPALAEASGSSPNSVRKYWQNITTALGLKWLNLPAIQKMSKGGERKTEVRVALKPELVQQVRLYVDHERYKDSLITFVIHIQPLLPDAYSLDLDTLVEMISVALPPPVSVEPKTGVDKIEDYLGRRLTHDKMLKAAHLAQQQKVSLDLVSLDQGGWWIKEVKPT